MTVIEKAARALAWNPIFADGLSSGADVQRWEDEHWPEFVDQALAVLTEGMVTAGGANLDHEGATLADELEERAGAVWQAMIDAAMAEEG